MIKVCSVLFHEVSQYIAHYLELLTHILELPFALCSLLLEIYLLVNTIVLLFL